MDDRVVHCPGPLESAPCGRYATQLQAERANWVDVTRWRDDTGWTKNFICPRCAKAGRAAKLRALLLSGERPHAEWNEEERAMAAQMLGAELASKPPKEAA